MRTEGGDKAEGVGGGGMRGGTKSTHKAEGAYAFSTAR